MITFTDASIPTPHFRDVCKKSAGLLRFCSIVNIANLKESVDEIRAETLASISGLLAELKLCTDIMIKEQESELFPLFDDIINIVSKTNNPATNCLNTISLAKSRVESAVRNKISTEDSGIVITDYKGEVKKYSDESIFRDASAIYDIFEIVSDLDTSQLNLANKIKQLSDISIRFNTKHYNIALRLKTAIEEFISKYKELINVSDACAMSLEINSLYKKDHESLMLLLDSDIEHIINTVRDIYVKK